MSLAEIGALFTAHYGEEPAVITTAPGRINLIGEHTDYNDGFVFPAAIDRGLYLAARVVDGPSEMTSRQLLAGQTFDTMKVAPGDLDSWSKYPAGMAWVLRENGFAPKNLQAYVDSDVPVGSGVSSSAAIEMAFGVAWDSVGGFGISNKEMALFGQRCENAFVGVNSGIMDQMASAMGRDGMAMFLDTRTLEIEYAPVPAEISVVLCDTKKPRALTDSAYNERRSQCEEASRILGVGKLRDATMEMLLAARDQMSDVVFRRAKHVISENDRCVRFKQALDAGDLKLAGTLVRESHVSLRDDYEVSCTELDVMAEAAAGAPGCLGARMMGAGFGGACVALVYKDDVEEFIRITLDQYGRSTQLRGEAMACQIVEGARLVQAHR